MHAERGFPSGYVLHSLKIYCAKSLKTGFMDADYIYAMDSSNYMALTRRFGNASGKISMFLDKDVEDPWYSGDFNAVFNDIFRGCTVLLEKFHQIYDGLCRLH